MDGVAPAVIGGGPPESPLDLELDPVPRRAEPYHYEQRPEPPTAPIPVLRLPEEEQKRKSWVSRVFRLPGN